MLVELGSVTFQVQCISFVMRVSVLSIGNFISHLARVSGVIFFVAYLILARFGEIRFFCCISHF
jgi:hypothetical protein